MQTIQAVSKFRPFVGRFATYPPTQGVSPLGIESEEIFGAGQLNLTVLPFGLSTAEAFGMTEVEAGITAHVPSLIIPINKRVPLIKRIGGSGVFPQTIVTSSIESGELFGNITLQLPFQLITPTAIGSGETFGTSLVIPGVVLLNPSGIETAEVFGSVELVQLTGGLGAIIFRPHTEMTPFLSRPLKDPPSIGSQFLVVNSIESGETFGNPTTKADITLLLTSIGSQEVFNLPRIIQYIKPASIPSVELVETPVITVGEVVVLPTPIDSQEWFGLANIFGGKIASALIIFKRRRL